MAVASIVALVVLGASCSSNDALPANETTLSANNNAASTTVAPVADLPDVVVTYSVLAALVSDLVKGVADVITLIPDGQDPHTFEPSAKDIATL
ncbi:MAG: hypothetical protein EBZ98_01540, partial [Actinobacteria bacterium]|nr:hypothetical protein [Actinomycetota bacterium]